MTHTFTNVYETRDGNRHIVFGDLAVTSTGTATGELLAATTDFGMTTIYLLSNAPLTSASPRYSAVYDYSTGKMRYFRTGAGGSTAVDLFSDAKGALDASRVTDAAATANLNSGFVHAAGMSIAATTAITTAFTAPDYPRNVVVEITNAGGATLVASNFVIVGTDQFGNAQTETLALDVTTPTLGAGKFRNQVGVKIFATVTSFAVDTAQPASTTAALGLGTKLGLRNNVAATSDIKVVQKNTAAIASSTYAADATRMAVQMGANLADNDEVYIEYAVADAEAPAATNVGTVRVRVEGV